MWLTALVAGIVGILIGIIIQKVYMWLDERNKKPPSDFYLDLKWDLADYEKRLKRLASQIEQYGIDYEHELFRDWLLAWHYLDALDIIHDERISTQIEDCHNRYFGDSLIIENHSDWMKKDRDIVYQWRLKNPWRLVIRGETGEEIFVSKRQSYRLTLQSYEYWLLTNHQPHKIEITDPLGRSFVPELAA